MSAPHAPRAPLPPFILGVDPGVDGGLALLSPFGTVLRHVGLSPEMTDTDLVDELRRTLSRMNAPAEEGGLPDGTPACVGTAIAVYLEKVGYMRGDGGKGAFTFGRIYGFLRGAICAMGVRGICDVPPVVWMSSLSCLSGGDKNVTLKKAQELFPSVLALDPSQWARGKGPGRTKGYALKIADALLIAEYGRRRETDKRKYGI